MTTLRGLAVDYLRLLVKAISLFSGCGGLDLGAARGGAGIIYATDRDRFAEAAYHSLLDDVPFERRCVSTITRLPKADLYLAGYPCQAFSQGGARKPEADPRAALFRQFARLLDRHAPPFFVAENVNGLRRLRGGQLLREQLEVFESAGRHGYRVATRLLRAEEYGVPQRRRRIFIVGVRRDLGRQFRFPEPTHGAQGTGLLPFESHGDAIQDLPLWPEGEFYELAEEARNFPWWYMSRNRKAPWDGPAYTVLANHRHVTLHPASPMMELVWSRIEDGSKQLWRFSDHHEHLGPDPSRPVLPRPRRLSVRECARIQGLPDAIELPPHISVAFRLVGNAVPPGLAHAVTEGLITGGGLHRASPSAQAAA